MRWLSLAEAGGFYAVHRERPFFKDLVDFMTSGPVMIQVLEGESAIAKNRDLMGATDPKKAAPGTIRADFAKSIDANASTAPTARRRRAPRSLLLPGIGGLQPLTRAGAERTHVINLLDLDAAGLAALFAEIRARSLFARSSFRSGSTSGSSTDVAA
jgi:hypothetical protein